MVAAHANELVRVPGEAGPDLCPWCRCLARRRISSCGVVSWPEFLETAVEYNPPTFDVDEPGVPHSRNAH